MSAGGGANDDGQTLPGRTDGRACRPRITALVLRAGRRWDCPPPRQPTTTHEEYRR
jgi:hypothetical protein